MRVTSKTMFNNEINGLNLDKIYSVVRGQVRKMLKDLYADDIDDAIQDIVIKIINKATLMDNTRGTVDAWVATIAKNHCLDLLRKYKRTPFELMDDERRMYNYYDEESYEEREERYVAMEAILEDLNQRDKDLLVYRFYDKKTSREISELVDIPEKSVPMYVKRAKLKMEKSLSLRFAA
jgi:RNA polymerase sigma-70 factor (ECF subfamily)